MRRISRFALALSLAATILPSSAFAIDAVDSTALRNETTPSKIRPYLRHLQAIADRLDDNRAAGTRGYRASVNYVKSVLTGAGYVVSEQFFDFNLFTENKPAVAVRAAPGRYVYVEGTDILTMEYSASGAVLKPVALAKRIQIPPGEPGTTESGCLPSDFGPEVAGKIVLIQRGFCPFADKVANATAAGAAAAVIFNEGQPGRTEVVDGTLGDPATIPVIGASHQVGKYIVKRMAEGRTINLRIKTDTTIETVRSSNVLAEKPGSVSDRVVVVGAHLDSVDEGPGINDNGSGTATLLATAVGISRLGIVPRNTLRFAFWGAEESGLIGSTHYVENLSEADLGKIGLNLNFDMLASPNYARFIYDGDGTLGDVGPDGSDVIEEVFETYFNDRNLATEPTAFDGRSDYFAFIEAGIPAGGLFSGAEELKSAAQVPLYGGTAGVAFDACYHQACDTIANINNKALLELGGAAVHSILTFAQTSEDIRARAKSSVMSAAAAKAEYRGGHLIR